MVHIIEITVPIPTKFCTTINITKCSTWVIQTIHDVYDPNKRTTNPRWRTTAIFKKNDKSPFLANCLTDRLKIWSADTFWTSLPFRRAYGSVGAVFLTKSPCSVKHADMGAPKIQNLGCVTTHYPVGFATTRHCLMITITSYGRPM